MLKFILITIAFQLTVFSLSIIFKRYYKLIAKHIARLYISIIFILVGGITIYAIKLFPHHWFLFYVINFPLIILWISIWMIYEKRTK